MGVSEENISESIEMVWSCGKNGCLSDGLKGVDFGSKWRADTRETAAGLDGWCEGNLGQQRNDGAWRLSVNVRKIGKSGEPWYTYVTE